MLEDFRLKVFMAVAQHGSFTKAADSLRISQPAVSQHVAELEKGLGYRLFQRMRGETVLTPEGEVFASHASRILSAAADAQLLFSSLDCTTVRIAVPVDIYNMVLLPALSDFMTVHPEVTLEQTTSDDHDILVAVEPLSASDRTSIRMVYTPKQAFALTKTCQVLKNILGF